MDKGSNEGVTMAKAYIITKPGNYHNSV